MRQGEAGQAASELDEILEVMEKREMDNKLHCGGEDAALVGEETWCGEEELIVEDLDGEETGRPAPSAGGQTSEPDPGPGPAGEPGPAAGSKPVSGADSAQRSGAVRMPRRASLIRPVDGLLAAFWIPVVIMIIIFIQREIFPFGENSFLRTDMYHQYAPFFSEFHHKLRTGGSLLYSWDVGGGVNFAALYAYYLASPVNWLIILCPKAYIIEFMT